MKRLLALLAFVGLVAVLAGCGGDDNGEDTTEPETPPVETTQARAYWLREAKVWPTQSELAGGDSVEQEAQEALEVLLEGPAEDATELGLTTAIPDGTDVESLELDGDVVRLQLSTELSDEALAQVVYTLTQFPNVSSVDVQGQVLTRSDFEAQTPAVLVESPLAFEEVEGPLQVTGTANTFEATFQYELRDADDQVVAEDFVTATSGSGERGTFEFTVPLEGRSSGSVTLVVFEISAEDGSRVNVVEIPLRLES